MLAWIAYETVTTEDDQTVPADIGFITPDDEHVSHEGVVGDEFIDLQHRCAHVVTLEGDLNEQVLAAADWVREHLNAIDHLDPRADGTLIAYEADIGPVDDGDPYVRSVIVRTSPYLVDGIVRVLEGRA